MNSTEAVATLKALTPYNLARMAECDAANEEARDFLTDVRDAVTDLLSDPESWNEGELDVDIRDSLKDDAPPVWHQDRLLAVLGAKAFNEASDFTVAETTVTDLCGYVLMDLAGVLVDALADRYKELLAEDDDDLVGTEPTA